MTNLDERSGGVCELCGSVDGLASVPVPPREEAVHACVVCREQLQSTTDPDHWRCLQASAWSDVPAVQVVAWRVLKSLDAGWAVDLREQLWLDDDTRDWAETELQVTVDSNGTPLADGDSVTLIKDLDVKGAGFTAKRGTMVKNIRLSDDPGLIEGRVNKTAIFLKTEFLKKA